jgi:hypothetical protein
VNQEVSTRFPKAVSGREQNQPANGLGSAIADRPRRDSFLRTEFLRGPPADEQPAEQAGVPVTEPDGPRLHEELDDLLREDEHFALGLALTNQRRPPQGPVFDGAEQRELHRSASRLDTCPHHVPGGRQEFVENMITGAQTRAIAGEGEPDAHGKSNWTNTRVA